MENLICWVTYAVYPMKYAHRFVVLCFVVVIISSWIVDSYGSFTHNLQGCITSTGQVYDCPSAREETLKYMDKINFYQTIKVHNKSQTVCSILKMYESCAQFSCCTSDHIQTHETYVTLDLTDKLHCQFTYVSRYLVGHFRENWLIDRFPSSAFAVVLIANALSDS